MTRGVVDDFLKDGAADVGERDGGVVGIADVWKGARERGTKEESQNRRSSMQDHVDTPPRSLKLFNHHYR